jgi:tRNA dimethylallyltransferase
MSNFQQLALIGPTASGKSALSLELAKQNNAHILSLDSLAIYKEINIASAKPSLEERNNIRHFGIDVIFPDEAFDVTTFIQLYKDAKAEAIKEEKNLIIVGGTSFYLNILINGISDLPKISFQAQQKTNALLRNVDEAHKFLYRIDKEYLKSITIHDRYRLEKMLNLYFETDMIPTEYFKAHPPKSTVGEDLPIYEITVDRDILRKRIKKRTLRMIKCGLIDEVFYLEKNYTRLPNSMKAIGIKEVLSYLDGHYTKMEMKEKIIIHTAQLAKRQRTFNNSKFVKKIALPLEELENLLLNKAILK